MPRDEHAVVEPSTISLPGGRQARACPADDAGEVRLWVVDGDPIGKLATLGWIDRDQHAAAANLVALYEATGLRQRLSGRYDGVLVDGVGDTGSQLEHMTGSEARAWRRLHRLLRSAPLHSRGEVEAVVIHGLKPISIARLKTGLAAIARALRSGR